jgi:hypothetical protein
MITAGNLGSEGEEQLIQELLREEASHQMGTALEQSASIYSANLNRGRKTGWLWLSGRAVPPRSSFASVSSVAFACGEVDAQEDGTSLDTLRGEAAAKRSLRTLITVLGTSWHRIGTREV